MARARRGTTPRGRPRVLIVGGGGREHAIAWKLRAEHPSCSILAAPGNPGIADLGLCFDVPATDVDRIVELAIREEVDLVIVGPEAPLAAGLVDRLRERRVAAFGPTAAAAQLETSKAFAKALMQSAGVPTARAEVHRDAATARRAVRGFGAPVVIKASGLAAGKGVVVCRSMGEAYEALDMMLLSGGMGDAGREVLVEEHMSGEELSLFFITDGERAVPLIPAQDHKRLRSGDEGPNTGGMGAYAPVSIATAEVVREVEQRIVEPTLGAMRDRGTPFTGLLYVGAMLTDDGVRVVEFNCRFGDPEAEAVLPLLECRPSLLDLMLRVGRGEVLPIDIDIRASGHAVTTVVASSGYPEKSRIGDRLALPTVSDPGVHLFHAGTRRGASGELETAGGRVVAVTAVADSFEEAQRLSAQYAERIRFPGRQFRPDIGWRERARRAEIARAGASGD